jgi:hypothetical protein
MFKISISSTQSKSGYEQTNNAAYINIREHCIVSNSFEDKENRKSDSKQVCMKVKVKNNCPLRPKKKVGRSCE